MKLLKEIGVKAWINKTMLESMPEPSMKAWLFAVARNSAVDMKRKEKYLTDLPDHDLPDDENWDITNKLTVQQLVKLLPSELSIPVHLKYYQGYNSTEIGNIMGISPATVRTRLRKAMSIMRKKMTDDSIK